MYSWIPSTWPASSVRAADSPELDFTPNFRKSFAIFNNNFAILELQSSKRFFRLILTLNHNDDPHEEGADLGARGARRWHQDLCFCGTYIAIPIQNRDLEAWELFFIEFNNVFGWKFWPKICSPTCGWRGAFRDGGSRYHIEDPSG